MSKYSIFLAVLGSVVAMLAGCGPRAGTYCQSGPKYGTQCYSQMDLEPPGTPPPPPGDRSRR